MKHLTKLAFAILTVLTFSACSEDQTAFNIEKVPGRATVQGTVTYNEGTTLSGGKFSYNYKPAANLTIFVTVDNYSYAGNLGGQTVFETTTDDNGKYSIELPVSNNMTTFSVRTAQFKGVQSTIEKVNNKITTVNRNVIYGASSSVDLQNAGIAYCDMICQPTAYSENLPENFGQTVTLKGKVGQNTYVYTPMEYLPDYYGHPWYEDARISPYFIEANGIDLIISIKYKGEWFALNATTNSQGEYSVQVPVAECPASFDYSIEALPKIGTFTQYYSYIKEVFVNGGYHTFTDYLNIQLNGYYRQYNQINEHTTATVTTAPQIAPNIRMVFEPYADQDTYGYQSYLFDNAPWRNN